jgi:hypothetical protein
MDVNWQGSVRIAAPIGQVYRYLADRKPREPLTKGEPDQTLCEVRELMSNRRIAWHSHMLPGAGPSADLDFNLAAVENGDTLLIQHQRLPVPDSMVAEMQRMFDSDVLELLYMQWEAGLRNIKAILEESAASA